MMSAGHWKERRAFWHALVFWVWLTSFVFGFAASDILHSARCPERLALQNAGHSSSAHFSTSHFSTSHAIDVDIECATCALQLAGLGILAQLSTFAAPLFLTVALAALASLYASLCALVSCARGPPALVI